MAKYLSTHTGEEIDNAVGKASILPDLNSGDAGKYIMVDNIGHMVAQNQPAPQLKVLAANAWDSQTKSQTLTSVKEAGYSARVSPAQTWDGATDLAVYNNEQALADANIYRIIEANSGTGLTFVCETIPSIDIKVTIEVFK